MSLSYCAQSHPGLRRAANEDAYLARPDLGLFAVADGLGGHAAGQVASRLAIEAVEGVIGGTLAPDEWVRCGLQPPNGEPIGAIVEAFRMANCHIGLHADAAPELAGMGSTLAAVLLAPPAAGTSERLPDTPGDASRTMAAPASLPGEDAGIDAVVAHVGDSRVYRWSGGTLACLTDDHSWVQEQVRRGGLTAAEARRHPWRNLITRALSGGDDLEVDVDRLHLAPGDRLLVCSDGLSSVVPDDEIGHVLACEPDDQLACEALVRAANAAGGPDNITVIVVTP